jgi:hypothetical protein
LKPSSAGREGQQADQLAWVLHVEVLWGWILPVDRLR